MGFALPSVMGAEELRRALTSELARRVGLEASELDTTLAFTRYGLDSAGVVALSAWLSELLGREVSPTLFWKRRSVDALVAYLTGGESEAPLELAQERKVPRQHEPIALVGLACRFPGAPDARAFWQLLLDGVDATGEVPRERWDRDALTSDDPTAKGKAITRRGGFLPEIAGFDSLFFGVSPREAEQLDPQQRLFLEVTWEALEDAGIVPSSLHGREVGVFVGAIWNDYAKLAGASLTGATSHTATGGALNMVANRVSYVLGLAGPSLVVDTACSSSLVAVHLACQSLWSGECEAALVGGVNLMVSPHTMVALSKFGGLSPDGRCKAFSAHANGFGRGEGAGVVVLKPLSRAIADGDTIRCVIRATGMNNDGPSNGLTAPNPEAQERLLRRVYGSAGIDPSTVSYVEAHGAGTALGDPIEASALGALFAPGRPSDDPLWIGSVKTNLGHLEGAAGIAGLIKAALSLEHRVVPSSLHFDEPNPHIDFQSLRLKVAARSTPYPHPERAALAGVSSFGWGGTNAHVVLEEHTVRPLGFLPLAAADEPALDAERTRVLAAARAGADLCGLCQAAERASDGAERMALTVSSREELIQALESSDEGKVSVRGVRGHAPGRRARVAFVCSPQGGQWVGMGRTMLESEPAFRARMQEVDAALRPHLGFSVIDELFRAEGDARFDDVSVIQPVLFAFQVALAAQWSAWGVVPDAVVGHSLGEIAAAHIAGMISLSDAARIVSHYSRLQKRLADRGGMGVVELAPDQLVAALGELGAGVGVAALNGPRSTVLSGPPRELDTLLERLKAQKVRCARIRVNVAAHHPQVDEIAAELEGLLAGFAVHAPRLPMFSTLHARELAREELNAAYFVQNLRQPVQLSPVVQDLLGQGFDAFVELSPNPVLCAALRQAADDHGGKARVLPSLTRDDDERLSLYQSRGVLFCLGAAAARTAEAQVVALSARTPEALRALSRASAESLARTDVRLDDVATTAAQRRTHHAARLSVVASDVAQLTEALSAHAEGMPHERLTVGDGKGRKPSVVFVFPGQGSQWHGMARELLANEPVFRAAVMDCDAAIQALTGWSVAHELTADEASTRMHRVDVIQPVLFTVAVALAAQWRAWGVEPAGVIGHSMGEVAAAHVAGALSLEDAARIICKRSQLLRTVSGQGAMLAVELTLDEARELIRDHQHLVSIAVNNSTRSTVLSGNREALDALRSELEAEGVFSRWVKVDVASHSPQMDPLREPLLEVLSGLAPRKADVRIFSTVTAQPTDGRDMTPDYWVNNLREPVLFASAVRQAREQGHSVFVEMSPHPILLPAVDQELAELGLGGMALPSLRRNDAEREGLLRSLAELYVAGWEPRWEAVLRCAGQVVPLPAYPWQHERFWLEQAPLTVSVAQAARPEGHDLLGVHVPSPVDARTHVFATSFGDALRAALSEHVVEGESVAPGALFLALLQGAGERVLGGASLVVRELTFEAPLLVSTGSLRLQTVLVRGDERSEVCVYAETAPGRWTRHARGFVQARGDSQADVSAAQRALTELPQLAPAIVERKPYYEALAGHGLDYGPGFQGIARLWLGEGCALARVVAPDGPLAEAPFDVRVVDAALQAIVGCLSPEHPGMGLVSGGVSSFELHAPLPPQFFSHVKLRAGVGAGPHVADVVAVDRTGKLLFCALGVSVHARPREGTERAASANAQDFQVPQNELVAELEKLHGARRRARLEEVVRELSALVLKLAVERVPVDLPFRSLGMDSVMALELRNRINARTGLRLSATMLFNHPTVEALTAAVLSELSLRENVPMETESKGKDTSGTEVAELSELDAELLLAMELERVQQLMGE